MQDIKSFPRSDTVATTMTTPSGPSPGATVYDYDAVSPILGKLDDTKTSQAPTRTPTPAGSPEPTGEKKDAPSVQSEPLAAKLSQAKKWGLLGVFSLGFFVDIWSYSAFFIFTDPITQDLGVDFAQQSWIIVSLLTHPSLYTKLTPDILRSDFRRLPVILGACV